MKIISAELIIGVNVTLMVMGLGQKFLNLVGSAIYGMGLENFS